MKPRIFCITILFLLCSAFRGDSGENLKKRIRFQVTAVAESVVLAQTTIEGLPGTDFNINLNAGNFKMQARFLTDLVADDRLKVRASLDTRRFYGYSPINLPLYEEDNQKHTLDMGFSDNIVLLPFGRNGVAETLKIEIVPTMLYVPDTPDASKLTINFDQKIENGEMTIEAYKTPHRFDVEAILMSDGRPIARGRDECLMEEEKEIEIKPLAGDPEISEKPFVTRMSVNKFIRNGSEGLIDIGFDLYRPDQMIIKGGAGMSVLGNEFSYPLEATGLRGEHKYELKFNIRLAAEQ